VHNFWPLLSSSWWVSPSHSHTIASTPNIHPTPTDPPPHPKGYYTSRPTSKGFIRASTAHLQAARQLQLLSGLGVEGGASTDKLEWAVSIAQVRGVAWVGLRALVWRGRV